MSDFIEASVIGHLGESLAEACLQEENAVYRFGYEHSLHALTRKSQGYEYEPSSNMVRAMPDFILFNANKKHITFLEVKTSQDINDLPTRYAYSHSLHTRAYYSFRDAIRYYPDIVFMDISWSSKPSIKFFRGSLQEPASSNTGIIFKELTGDELPFECSPAVIQHMIRLIERYRFVESAKDRKA